METRRLTSCCNNYLFTDHVLYYGEYLKRIEYGEYLKPIECTNNIIVVEVKKMDNIFTLKPSIETPWEKNRHMCKDMKYKINIHIWNTYKIYIKFIVNCFYVHRVCCIV